jgi:uncharacterized protein (TIGR02246 family)
MMQAGTHRRRALYIIAGCLFHGACASSAPLAQGPRPSRTPEEITVEANAFLQELARVWNARDLDQVMGIYASDPVYVWAGSIHLGRQAVERDLRATFFPDAESGLPLPEGRLSLTLSDVMELEDDLIVVTARARLSFEEASVAEFNGVTTRILRKVDGRWRIAYDHSS